MSVGVNRKSVLAVTIVGVILLTAWVGWRDAGNHAAAVANTRTLMDAETGDLVEVHVEEGFGPFPALNHKTGRRTLYPTEVCYSKTCAARGGTHVILNSYLGKDGPTLCPVCGAEVRFHNPGPSQTATAGW